MINNNNKMKLLFVIIVSVISVYFGFEYILPLFTPFIVAYLIAWALLPLVRFLNHNFRMPKMLGGILSLCLVGTISIWIISYLGNIFIQQVTTLLQNLPIYLTMLSSKLDSICGGCDKFLGIHIGSARDLLDTNMDTMLSTVKTDIMPKITSQSLNLIFGVIGTVGIILIIIVSILLLIKDEEVNRKSFRRTIFYSDIHLVTSKLSETGIAYLKTQAIMMLFIAIFCTLGLLLLNNKYALLIGIGIGVFDAFPILGSGFILVPWSIISLLNKDIFAAAILMTLYLGCQIIRQFLEPKLLGNRIGIKPIFTLMSMFIGFRLFGFTGVLLGPLGLVIITTIVKEAEQRLILSKV